jgi:hypothetical protein
MQDLEIFYINRRRNELRSKAIIEENSFIKGTIKEYQHKQTLVALNARQSELMQFENFSKNIEGFDARKILEICDSLLIEENKRLKDSLKDIEDVIKESRKVLRENKQLKKKNEELRLNLRGQSKKITELIGKAKVK